MAESLKHQISQTSVLHPEDPETLLSSPASITSTSSTNSINSTSKKQHDITFDLFAIPVKTTAILSEDSSFCRPLNIALKCIPWIEVTLEIRPTNKHRDSKLYPIHRVIMPSGSSLSEISKALDKSWKSLIPDQTAFSPDCFIRNSELLYPQKKTESDSNVEYYDKHSNKFMSGMTKRVPTVDLWLRQKETSNDIPPGILTPYIIEDVLRELEEKKEEEFANEQVLLDKEKEAELEKESPMGDLPKYETAFGDVLLESGKI